MAYTDIDKPTDYFNTVLYTGTGSAQSITGVGFQPQMLWIKGRTNVFDHRLADIVRGTPNLLYPNISDAETADANNISSIDSDGFSLGTGNAVNQSGQTFVSWNWLSGGTASSNTDGSITSNVSASTTNGFSIVSYTGTGANATIGHGLGSVPKVMFVKRRSTSSDWTCYFETLGNTKRAVLNSNAVPDTASTFWNSTTPTSSVFSVGTSGGTNASSETYIAYCFAEKKGFSKFGSYTGNGNADGTFVYTGMRPAFVIVKRTDSTSDWYMYDNKRDSINVMSRRLESNNSDAEVNSPSAKMDFVSNGIKFRGTDAAFNVSGATYIFMCFAENPFTTSTGIPTTAR